MVVSYVVAKAALGQTTRGKTAMGGLGPATHRLQDEPLPPVPMGA